MPIEWKADTWPLVRCLAAKPRDGLPHWFADYRPILVSPHCGEVEFQYEKIVKEWPQAYLLAWLLSPVVGTVILGCDWDEGARREQRLSVLMALGDGSKSAWWASAHRRALEKDHIPECFAYRDAALQHLKTWEEFWNGK